MKKIIPMRDVPADVITLDELLAGANCNKVIILKGCDGNLYKATNIAGRFSFCELDGIVYHATGLFNTLKELLEDALYCKKDLFVFDNFDDFVANIRHVRGY